MRLRFFCASSSERMLSSVLSWYAFGASCSASKTTDVPCAAALIEEFASFNVDNSESCINETASLNFLEDSASISEFVVAKTLCVSSDWTLRSANCSLVILIVSCPSSWVLWAIPLSTNCSWSERRSTSAWNRSTPRVRLSLALFSSSSISRSKLTIVTF